MKIKNEYFDDSKLSYTNFQIIVQVSVLVSERSEEFISFTKMCNFFPVC